MKNHEMSTHQVLQLEEFIKTLGEDELVYLNRLIIERLKLISQADSTTAMSRFNPGEKVCFTEDNGMLHTGYILKLNKKTVSIRTDRGERWKVSPHFLEKAE